MSLPPGLLGELGGCDGGWEGGCDGWDGGGGGDDGPAGGGWNWDGGFGAGCMGAACGLGLVPFPLPRSVNSRTTTTKIITMIATPYKDELLPEEDFCATVVVVGNVVWVDIAFDVFTVVVGNGLTVVETEEVEVEVETELVEVVTLDTTSNINVAGFTFMFVLFPANVTR